MIKYVLRYVSILLMLDIVLSATMIGSKHDLSLTNYYGKYPGASEAICVFCHTPHGSNTADVKGPIWNRNLTDTSVFTMYNGMSGVPNNSTLVCLSCHDGVSGLGDVSAVDPTDTHIIINGPGAGHSKENVSPNCYACHFSGEMFPEDIWRIGPNLTNDHPVSVSFADAKTKSPTGFLESPINGLKLVDGKVECVSCHDPHLPDNGRFLRTSNDNSALCFSCHVK